MTRKAKGGLVVVAAVAGACAWLLLIGRQPPDGERQVRWLVDRYFASWSARSMDEYRDCFHPAAVITFVDGAGRAHPSGLGPFIESQKEAHRAAPVPMREIPTRVDVHAAGRIAQAAVCWELTKGASRVTGTDMFTMQNTDAGWKIIGLVFAND
jgi:hypothetical protein